MNYEVISRVEAHFKSVRLFYTGRPCRKGHLAQRYVSNGACCACLKSFLKFKVNSFTPHLAPYIAEKLWCPKAMTRDDMIQLRFYLQRCIYAYAKDLAVTQGKVDWWTNDIEREAARHETKPPNLNDPREYP